MNLLEDHEAFSISHLDLKNVIEHLKNYKYRCILKSPKPTNYICNSEKLLVHLEIDHENLALIDFLPNNSHNVNAENSYDDTELLVALKSNNSEAVQILLGADVEIRVTGASHETVLGLLTTKRREVMEDIEPYFVKNLKTSKLEFATLVEIFSVDLELNMNLAMDRRDFKIVELIMRLHRNESGKLAFYKKLFDFHTMDRLELWTAFIRRFAYWHVISIETLAHFDCMFQAASANYLEILLECGIHVQLRETFNVDVRVAMFGNSQIDAIELLRKHNFNVNAQSLMQESALHFAVKNNLVENVSFLLDSGADVDIKDEWGRTALFDCANQSDINCTKLLLAHGANVQVADNNGLTIFEAGKRNPCLMKCLIAQLAIDALRGVSIKQTILDQIHSNGAYQNTYEACFEELSFLNKWIIGASVVKESMEECAATKYVSFYTVLTDKVEKFHRHIHTRDAISLLDQCNDQYNNLHGLYYSTLKIKLIKASNLHRFKSDIAQVISKITEQFVDFDHLATRHISEYLTDKDIEQFVYSFTL